MAEQDLKSAFEDQGAPKVIEQFDPEVIPVEPVAVEPPVVDTQVQPTTPEPPVGEPIVDPVVQSAEPIVEPPVVPAAEPTFFDKLKGTQVKKEEPAKPELPDDVKQKLEEYERITNSDLFKIFNGEKDLSKVDLKELGKKLSGEDFTKLDDKDLLQRTLKLEYPNISDTDLEKAVDSRSAKFDALEDWEQTQERLKMAEGLSKNHKPDDVFQTLETIKKNQVVNPVQDQKKAIDDYRQKIVTLYEDLAKQAVGQEYNGYVMNEEDGKATIDEFNDNVENFTPEKNFLRMMKAATYEKAVAAAEQRGYEKAMIEKGKPDFGKTGAPAIQPLTQEGLKNMTLADFFEMQPA